MLVGVYPRDVLQNTRGPITWCELLRNGRRGWRCVCLCVCGLVSAARVNTHRSVSIPKRAHELHTRTHACMVVKGRTEHNAGIQPSGRDKHLSTSWNSFPDRLPWTGLLVFFFQGVSSSVLTWTSEVCVGLGSGDPAGLQSSGNGLGMAGREAGRSLCCSCRHLQRETFTHQSPR